jgi:hypothetical protein
MINRALASRLDAGDLTDKALSMLKKNADVFCRQVGLIQDNRPSSNFEVIVGPAQQVMPGTDEEILVLLHTGSIAQKIRVNFDF